MNKIVPIAVALALSLALVSGCLGGEEENQTQPQQPPANNQTTEEVPDVGEDLNDTEEALNSAFSDIEEMGNLSSLTVEEDL